jgi:PKHD-type hydroxylase
MLLHIPAILDPAQLRLFRERLAAAAWADGKVTAGHQSARAKHNLQLAEDDPVALELGGIVRAALKANTTYFAAALPCCVFPPLFNRYRVGDGFGAHIDNAVRYDRTGQLVRAVRTDLSATLFLSSPDEYDGGELVVEDTFGVQRVKLPAGDMLLYPASSVHRVEPVTRGERLASFFWIQSLVRDAGERRLLFDLDLAIRKLGQTQADQPALVELTGVYHNLLRRWAEP